MNCIVYLARKERWHFIKIRTLVCSWSRDYFVEFIMFWEGPIRVRPGTRNYPYNENLTRALNTTSLKCCLPSPDTIDRREKIHTCVWRFKVTSCKRASLKSTRFSQKEIRSDNFIIEPSNWLLVTIIFRRNL